MKKSIFVFLFAIFLILAFYILTYGAGIFTSSRSYTEKQTKNSLCTTFFNFELKNISYENKMLSFRLVRKSETGEPFEYITISSGNETQKTIPILNMLNYKEQPLNIEINLSKNFTIYPENCKAMGKTFTLS